MTIPHAFGFPRGLDLNRATETLALVAIAVTSSNGLLTRACSRPAESIADVSGVGRGRPGEAAAPRRLERRGSCAVELGADLLSPGRSRPHACGCVSSCCCCWLACASPVGVTLSPVPAGKKLEAMNWLS